MGFFAEKLRPYGYEDLEFGFRLLGAQRKGVYFDPAAEMLHRHAMTLDQYLDREESLGVMTPVLHGVNPSLFEHLHGTRDLQGLAEKYRAWCAMDVASHGMDLPAAQLSGAGCRRVNWGPGSGGRDC